MGLDLESIVPQRRGRRDNTPALAFAPGEKPHDFQREKAVLCGVFLSQDAFVEIQNIIHQQDFYLPAHQEIFGAMVALTNKNTPIDINTVQSWLQDMGKLELIGGPAYLSEILNTPATSAHAIEYARILSDLSSRRNVAEALDIGRSLILQGGEIRDIVSEVERIVMSATQAKRTTTIAKIGSLLEDAVAEIGRRADNKDAAPVGVLTGLTDLDEALSGMRPAQLIVLAARPGMGKTSLSCNIMTDAALKQGKNVLFFSLEMSQAEVVERMISAESGVDASKIRSGHLSPDDFSAIFQAAEDMMAANLFIDDRSSVSPYDVLAQARKLNTQLRLENRGALDLIVVDYIQIMKSGGQVENRALEVAAITGGLKAIAKEIKVPVVALSQLNRESSKRPDSKPQLSDLKDSGSIEADADVVIFIHREKPGPESDSRAPAEAQMIIAKQRSGPTMDVKVTWLGHLTRFANLSHYHQEDYEVPPGGPSGGY
jgi:replicative DNA helicase